MTIDANWYQKPANIPVHHTSGGVVIRIEDGKVLVALVKEKDFSDYFLPKGKVEAGENLEEAARREIEEEAGLTDLELICELGVRERLNSKRDAWKVTHYFLFTTTNLGNRPTDTDHAYRCEWFDIENLPAIFWPEQEQLLVTNRDRITRWVTEDF